jgi:hypothetical protein
LVLIGANLTIYNLINYLLIFDFLKITEMIKKVIGSGFVLAISFILISAINKPFSNGAPTSSSGAPGEQTCAKSTCHDTYGPNSGTAKLSFEVPENIQLGESIPIKIKMEDFGKVRFGYQVTVLDENNQNTGTFIITDSINTQVLGDNINFPERKYLTYTYLGTLDKAGQIEWQANWKPTTKGKVTFYVAAISANNDGTDKGDYSYHISKSVQVSQTSEVKRVNQASQVTCQFKNNTLTILNPEYSTIKSITLSDIKGTIIVHKMIENAALETEIIIPNIPDGLFIASIHTMNSRIIKKFIITHD